VVVTVQAVEDLPPATGERSWTAEHYRERDAVLAAWAYRRLDVSG